jgi:ABC-type multidrug transport system fused ATPase/permease subunit
VVKAYVQEEKEKGKVSQLSWEYARKNVSVTKVWGMFLPLIMLFSNLSLVIVLYLGGRLTVLQSISTGILSARLSGNTELAHDGLGGRSMWSARRHIWPSQPDLWGRFESLMQEPGSQPS